MKIVSLIEEMPRAGSEAHLSLLYWHPSNWWQKTVMWFSQALRVNWEQLLTAIARNINEVENQVKI